jgi:aspartate racemase
MKTIDIPALPIADATADRRAVDGAHRVGLLRTRYTMEQAAYRERFEDAGFDVIVPGADERVELNRIRCAELCVVTADAESRTRVRATIEAMQAVGADSVIAGCTEIELLITVSDSPQPLFDTAAIHAQAAVEAAVTAEEPV